MQIPLSKTTIKAAFVSKMIYVEKEGKYDHLHTRSWQKNTAIQIDDDRYGSVSDFEDGPFSTLRKNKNVDHGLINK